MDTLTLKCWVYGDDSYTTFPVEISKMETVGALKGVIKDKNSVRFNSVDARYLILYSIPIPDDDHFEATLKQWTFKGQTRLIKRCTLTYPTAFSSSTHPILVHVYCDSRTVGPSVVAPDMTLNCWVRGDTTGSVFLAEISSTNNVAALKEAIKNKNQVDFRDIDADTLVFTKFPSHTAKLTPSEVSALSLSPVWGILCGICRSCQLFSCQCLPTTNSTSLLVCSTLNSNLTSTTIILWISDGSALSFKCWIQGAEPVNSFEVQITTKAMVDGLKNAIKAAYGNKLSPARLKLYKINR
ncbi:hypothetical protein J3R82DRAFT_9192 [Butyriboletus roseoflavus]|nr:hypothetical protein J3R82DRAFT_9192 [Butyriboletus roseoflavus]